MANDYLNTRPRPDLGTLREALGFVLLVAGAVGLAFAAFAVDWRLGVAVLSGYAIAAGVALGYER